MAIKRMYAIYDTEAAHFLLPISFVNDFDAQRWFKTQVNGNKEEQNVARYPEQFILYRLDDYDTQNGNFVKEEEIKTPKQLVGGNELRDEETKQYTVKQLINMLKNELLVDEDNKIVDLQKRAKATGEQP